MSGLNLSNFIFAGTFKKVNGKYSAFDEVTENKRDFFNIESKLNENYFNPEDIQEERAEHVGKDYYSVYIRKNSLN
jgi:hypothetical protein